MYHLSIYYHVLLFQNQWEDADFNVDEPIDDSEPVVEQSVNIHELPDVSLAMFSIHMLIFIVLCCFYGLFYRKE